MIQKFTPVICFWFSDYGYWRQKLKTRGWIYLWFIRMKKICI